MPSCCSRRRAQHRAQQLCSPAAAGTQPAPMRGHGAQAHPRARVHSHTLPRASLLRLHFPLLPSSIPCPQSLSAAACSCPICPSLEPPLHPPTLPPFPALTHPLHLARGLEQERCGCGGRGRWRQQLGALGEGGWRERKMLGACKPLRYQNYLLNILYS
jgi:hypothetical protein